MAAATCQISIWCTTATTGNSSAETTGLAFNRDATRGGVTAPIPIPTTTAGTNFSYPKYLGLEVTATGTTSIENRQVARSSAPPAGIVLYWDTTSLAAYTTPSSSIGTDNTTADDVDPDGASTAWVALTTSYAAYSTASAATVVGISGTFIKLCIGVSSTGTYQGGPGSAIALPNILVQYDEA